MRLYLCLALLLVPALGALDYFDPDYSIEQHEIEPTKIKSEEIESEEVESGENERDERGFSGGLDVDNGFCPHPFSQILDECFYTSDIELHWQAARHYCRGMDGDLASPSHVSALHAFIRTHQVDENVYLGGTNTGQTKKWLWLSGEAINKNDWYRGQPDNYYGEEHCLVMYYDYNPPLYDDSCENKRYFVCEFKSQ